MTFPITTLTFENQCFQERLFDILGGDRLNKKAGHKMSGNVSGQFMLEFCLVSSVLKNVDTVYFEIVSYWFQILKDTDFTMLWHSDFHVGKY